MNTVLRQVPKPAKPFNRRKPPMTPGATGGPETFIRFVVAQALALWQGREAAVVAQEKWPSEARLRMILRAASEPPADLSNAPALAAVMTSDFINALQPLSAAAQLMSAGIVLHFDRAGRIDIPEFVALDDLPPPFVAAGQPAPVAQLTSQATMLEPHKLEVLVAITREMLQGSNAERLIGDAVKRATAFGLDKALFDDRPGSAARPPGLRSYHPRLAESVAIENMTAMMQDLGALVGASERVAAGAPFYFIGRSRRIAAMRIMLNQVPSNFVLLPSAASQGLPQSVLLCVAPNALASAVGLPDIELVESATIEMDNAPGSPDLSQSQATRSLFQTDTIGLKLRIPISWALRDPDAANWITCLWPSDIGVGGSSGLPEAPFDEFAYGRRQGAWEPVVEEAPATGPIQAYVRLTPGAASSWYPLNDVLQNYAPIGSPSFFGNPTAPTPPPGDASTRLATTQFVADNAAVIGEIPNVDNAYARVRNFTGAGWVDFTTLRVAYLDNAAFTGSPTAPTPPPGDASTRLATTEFVRREGGLPDAPTAALHARSAGNWVDINPVFAQLAPVFSPNFLGLPTAPTPPPGDASTRLATTQFVADNAPSGGGVEDVATTPNGNFVRARTSVVSSGWVDISTLGYLPMSGGVMTGQLTVPSGGTQTNVGLGFGDLQSGIYRAGTTLGMSVGGVPQMQWMGTIVAFFQTVHMGNFTIQALGDPVNPTDALNLRTGDSRYLRSGGSIIAPAGTGPTNVGVGVGDASSGLYREGTSLAIAALGDAGMLFHSNRTAQLMWPLSMNGQVINTLADATADMDALNRRSGDGRYLRSGGSIIAPAGTGPTDVGVGVGDASSGLYRSGTSLAIAAQGDVHMLFNANRTAQLIWPLNVSGNVIAALGDATADTDALNRRSGDGRYLRSGGSIIAPAGTGVTDVGLGVGEASTGFFRRAGDLVVSQQGFPLVEFQGTRSVAFNGPLAMNLSAITGLADATADEDALNRRSGDSRYLRLSGGTVVGQTAFNGPLSCYSPPVAGFDVATKDYVDQQQGSRAPTVVFDLPGNVSVLGNGDWFTVGVVRIILPPRAGNYRLSVAVTCNVAELANIAIADVRLGLGQADNGNVIRRVWLFGAGPGLNAAGFSTILYTDVAAGTVDVPVQIKSISAGASPSNFTILGGGAVALRSQIALTDLGPP